MSSRITMVLAIVFLLGALIAGYLGIVVSKEPAPPPPPVEAPVVQAPPPVEVAPPAPPVEEALRQSVVVLARDVPPYTSLKEDDLLIERLKVAPVGSFSKIEDVLERRTWRPLAAGTWLSESSFEAGGSLARMIRPDERALALSVDEVIGAGGLLSPGDYVDVLLYLPEDTANPVRSSQVVVPALRILSVGGLLGLTRDGKPAHNISADERFQLEQQRINARSVVVAVPEALLSRLLLATQTGVLRLAVRSADEGNLQDYWTGDSGRPDVAVRLDTARRNLVQFSQLALSGGGNQHGGASRGSRGVEVIRGNQVTQQTP
ncbi:Flp pilus assembly protein CpaB [Pseudomonas cichorii]|uniref:Flp pilus assembly protein CpaB n=1 Tax=Pseudomonas cichorii TaxID=36746 RepID=UPI001C8A18DF|nr:Flp pilus assembly protein CpaB [Pseudomonas cichorii]MBX8531550.1 Flp pilus assembly protein CpaB [Pseudomonas cichorii]